MSVIRTMPMMLPAMMCMAVAVTAFDSRAQSVNSKESVFAACEDQMKAEFGEAEFEFGKIRREENRNMAFGELTLADGSKQQVRCTVQRGKVRGVKFRNGQSGTRSSVGFWTDARPEGAVFVPPAEETEDATAEDATAKQEVETETETAALPGEDAETETTAETTPGSATGDDAPADAEPTNNTQTATVPEPEADPEPEAEPEDDGKPKVRVVRPTPLETDTDDKATADAQTGDGGEAEQSDTPESENDPASFQPVFRRVN